MQLLIFLVFLSAQFAFSKIDIPEKYPFIRENLMFYRDDNLKIYYGGPITHPLGFVEWVMPAVFEDSKFNPESVFEISFIRCTPQTARDAKIFYIKAQDVNIKLKNILNDENEIFQNLISGKHYSGKYIVIRKTDIAMVTYPDLFIDSQMHDDQKHLQKLISILEKRYQATFQNDSFKNTISKKNVYYETDDMIIYEPEKIQTKNKGEIFSLYVTKIFLPFDKWKMYYFISKQHIDEYKKSKITLRIDSGCVSGQIYNDDTCDCLDQMNAYLKKIKNENAVIIHVPAHDGRGFGFAPKAETEIYKKGGAGRLLETKPLDTVEAARKLYCVPDEKYDIRDYFGAVRILNYLDCKNVILCTDNTRKKGDLEKNGINVLREATKTKKTSCQHHIQAKMNDPLYFKN